MCNGMSAKRKFHIGKKKIAILVALFLVTLASVVAYFALKTPKSVSTSEFSSFMAADGFFVANKTGDDGIDRSSTEAVIVAVKGDLNIQYRSFFQEEYAEKFYQQNSNAIITQYQGDLKETGGDGFERMRLAADFGRYYIVSRIGNTVIVAETYNSQSVELDEVIKNLGY